MSKNYKHSEYFFSDGIPKYDKKFMPKVKVDVESIMSKHAKAKEKLFPDSLRKRTRTSTAKHGAHNKKKVIDTYTGTIYNSVTECANKIGIHMPTLSFRIKNMKNYRFQFVKRNLEVEND